MLSKTRPELKLEGFCTKLAVFDLTFSFSKFLPSLYEVLWETTSASQEVAF